MHPWQAPFLIFKGWPFAICPLITFLLDWCPPNPVCPPVLTEGDGFSVQLQLILAVAHYFSVPWCWTYRDNVSFESMGWVCTLYYSTELWVAHSCLDPRRAHRPCNTQWTAHTLDTSIFINRLWLIAAAVATGTCCLSDLLLSVHVAILQARDRI